MTQRRVLTFLVLTAASVAEAHFVFVVPEPEGSAAKVFLSEELKPDGNVDLGLVAGARLWLRKIDGGESRLEMKRASDAYEIAIASRARLIHGVVDLGLTQRGADGKPHLLIYYPKTIFGDPFDARSMVGAGAPVEIAPVGRPGAFRLRLFTRGIPKADAEITVLLPDGSQRKVKTDDAGLTEVFTLSGRFGAWARFWEPVTGERDGKKYEEIRHYATLVFDSLGAEAQSRNRAGTHFAPLPRAVSSFGAVADGGFLYVYGGHIAPVHSYSTEAVSGQFARLNLLAPGTWEQLPGGPALQGMNLTAHGGKIYRIGGMAPRNAPGVPTDNHSAAECARFDPAIGKWEPLPAMPEPRSSHDVVVIGDTLIVVGGWNMQGRSGEKWADTILSLNLTADRLEWKSAPQPFKRRALVAAAYREKLFVMGGIDEQGRVSTDVDIYDPKTGVWAKGTKLPAAGIDTFAPAACSLEGRLYVSLASGALYRLGESGQEWEEVGRTTPRMSHRMVASGKMLLLTGGANNGKNLDLIESVEPGQGSEATRRLVQR